MFYCFASKMPEKFLVGVLVKPAVIVAGASGIAAPIIVVIIFGSVVILVIVVFIFVGIVLVLIIFAKAYKEKPLPK